MRRLDEDLPNRAERFAHRMSDLADAIVRQRRSRRVVDQITGCGTSVGANLFEADEAVSRPDFCKCLGIVNKELSESRFWVRYAVARKWFPAKRLSPLEAESMELRRIFGAMLARVRRNDRSSHSAE